MKLRKLMELCIHERCSAHWILDPEDERGGEMCSGGVFLPEAELVAETGTEALIAELVKRGEWPHGIPATPVRSGPFWHEEP